MRHPSAAPASWESMQPLDSPSWRRALLSPHGLRIVTPHPPRAVCVATTLFLNSQLSFDMGFAFQTMPNSMPLVLCNVHESRFCMFRSRAVPSGAVTPEDHRSPILMPLSWLKTTSLQARWPFTCETACNLLLKTFAPCHHGIVERSVNISSWKL